MKKSKKKAKRPTRAARAPKKARAARKPKAAAPAETPTPNPPAASNSLVISQHPDALKQRALAAYREAGTVMHACIAAGVGRRTWYDWMEQDPKFAAAAIETGEAVTDDLEKEAIKRAKEGSDTLIIFLLKSKRPEQYRETHKIEVVSPAVRENLRQTIAILNEELDAETAGRVLELLDKIWSDAA